MPTPRSKRPVSTAWSATHFTEFANPATPRRGIGMQFDNVTRPLPRRTTSAFAAQDGESAALSAFLNDMHGTFDSPVAGGLTARGGAAAASLRMPANAESGVWVSRDMWRAVRKQLDEKSKEVSAMQQDHTRHAAEFKEELEASRARYDELEEHFRQVERTLRAEVAQHERLAAALREDLKQREVMAERQRAEHVAQTEELMRRLWERDDVVARCDALTKNLDDSDFNLQVAHHRNQTHEQRIASLENELAYFKEVHEADQAKLMDLQRAQADANSTIKELEGLCESYKDELLTMRKPDEEFASEVLRLQSDNQRLVHMLEGTKEYGKFMQEFAAARGVHYMPLSECLTEEGMTSEPFAPLRDRPIVLDEEAYHWVPKRTIHLTMAFAEKLFPKVPIQPFMMLLLQLNKVWRDHEREKVQDIHAKTEKRASKLRRQAQQTKPYQQVVNQNRIGYLKKQLRTEERQLTKLREQKRDKTAKDKDENKFLLEWGLSTIEKLSQQVVNTTDENKSLRKHLTSMSLSGSPGAADGLHAPPSVPSYGGGVPTPAVDSPLP